MSKMPIRGISMNVKVFGHGYPLVLMHGGPSADLYTMMTFKPIADQFTLVFYDHRCNGRSTGAEVSTMSMENLTSDADALRQVLGFDKWAVLGHSFGGYVAMEYALCYPQNLSHLLLLDTGADNRWAQENASKVLAERGFSPEIVDLAHRFLNGQVEPNKTFSALMKLGDAYTYHLNPRMIPTSLYYGMQSKLRPEALIYSATHFLKGWSILDRLGEIQVPTLVMAGREDFIYPPEAQEELASRIPNARLVLIDRASHSPHIEQQAITLKLVREFLVETKPGNT